MTNIRSFSFATTTHLLVHLLLWWSDVATGFMYNPQAHPILQDFLKHQVDDSTRTTTATTTATDMDNRFKLQLDLNLIPETNDTHNHANVPTRLALMGPVVQLTTSTCPNKRQSKLSKDYPHVSTGTHAIDMVEPAHYVGLQGLEQVRLEQGCWELIWPDNHDCGKLVCAFDMPRPIHRNGATLDHDKKQDGPLYVSFHVYSHASLAAAQAFKHRTQQLSKDYLQDKEDHMDQLQATSNLLQKAWHYQQALAAVDKLLLLPIVSHIPESDELVGWEWNARNNELLFVTHEGLVWKKSNPLFGPSTHTLGKAYMSSMTQPQEEDNDPRRLRP